ncbi:50S ribosomal protein L24 [Candidatus Falkowbacteria bacterium CG_4_9_14_3_um_filter_36_9]|uniref:Large ribosomal subunit protein uL24 n=2 Tax=Candidatus Falkowiibacteriota TaxID=1752728 RepID=A0A1J4TDN7_9BACT|nr:MAG: 50S ribosomal protein L24 [Candidatus Falkowbacteria bacterium CG1_02_37_44]PIV51879.1 MAG: 50S ribosomal protein L24 [Candidatus Falkowbacteria bacterium CG02_land_8_20_14_3_00_36_14]PIX12080.1 MAG: 50S ribosomal protein L24 [Candidatus Falkowbacteria bacterium CG_4_8_14_3_um_filter_36_11]PJA10853.1 MAG: 50S ribosomal protein L24 [Candidatus Falkowbacteria bacterium CG_4_10_14_0_2_um_filter_36_22]PJB20212.1 MAG: 50S ribosomal protein L24 [Candidatus Falkowbacteria bacterium CG_4_9_14_3
MKIKSGDKIIIIAGKDKGKAGKVLQIFSSKNRVSVEGLNLLIKHLRPKKQGEKGQRVEFPALMDLSNVILECPKCGKATRVSYKITKKNKDVITDSSLQKSGQPNQAVKTKNKKLRICNKCKEIID